MDCLYMFLQSNLTSLGIVLEQKDTYRKAPLHFLLRYHSYAVGSAHKYI